MDGEMNPSRLLPANYVLPLCLQKAKESNLYYLSSNERL